MFRKKTRGVEEDPDAGQIDWLGWKLLHSIGIAADRLVDQNPSSGLKIAKMFETLVVAVSKIHPCSVCRTHMSRFDQPADVPGKSFEWSVALHNNVNGRTGKPILSLNDAKAHWINKVPILDEILEFFRLTASKAGHTKLADSSHKPLDWTHASVRQSLENLQILTEAGGQGLALKRAFQRFPLPRVFHGSRFDVEYFTRLKLLVVNELKYPNV